LPKLFFPYDKEEVSSQKVPMGHNVCVSLGHFNTTIQNLYLIAMIYF